MSGTQKQNSRLARLTPRSLSQDTYWRKEKLWFENLADNLADIRSGLDVQQLKKTCGGPCVIVGAGPSVDKFKHLDALKGVSCHVIATDRQLKPLLERGLVPEYVLSVDADPMVATFYDSDLVREYRNKIRAVFNVQVHHSVFEKFLGLKYWFTVLMDEPLNTEKSISRAIYWMTGGKTMSDSYGNVGGFAWAFADYIGHSPIILVGIDLSYGEDLQPMQTMFWQGLLEKRGGSVKDTLKLDYRWETNVFGYRVLTDALFDSYREVLQHGVEVADAVTVNCSPYTVLHGAKVHCMPLDKALAKYTLRL